MKYDFFLLSDETKWELASLGFSFSFLDVQLLPQISFFFFSSLTINLILSVGGSLLLEG